MPSQNLAAEGLETQLRHAFAELRSRLSAGVACRAEDLLSSHPELASDPELALQLIHAEFTIRRELGQKPNPAECFERFPSWRDRLEHQFQADGLDTSGNSEDAATAAQTTRFQPEHGPVTVAYAKDLQPEQGPAGADGIERQLGRFTLVEEIGRGGMGVVLKVHDPVLNRVVALKMIRGGFLAREDEVERFYREARAVAQLDHPHIVKIHDIGKHADQPL